MGFFSLSKSGIRYGIVIDIGSGSVLASIVGSNPTKSHPDIIWSKREYTPLKQSGSVSDSAKSVMTSLVTVLMQLDSEGKKVFYEKTGERKLQNLQVTIAAPWSYTVTKTISYKNNEDFEVSEELIEELLRTAQLKVQEELLENEHVHQLGLSIIVKNTMQVIANDYPIMVTGKQKANALRVIQVSAAAQEYLIEAILDAKNKLFPNAKLTQYSFMLPFFYIMNDVTKQSSEYCLVDITYEATELGIVRDGVLTYCTHTPFGSFSIAREISKILSITSDEAYSYLSEPDLGTFLEPYSEKQRDEVKLIFKAYQELLTGLFKETGDSLAIPKKIYLHGNLNTEPFFNKQILEAASDATKMKHASYNVTAELLTKNYTEEEIASIKKSTDDTALLISAQFFHIHDQMSKFEHL
jgi:hypothetical protein